MNTCKMCGKKGLFLKLNTDGFCSECQKLLSDLSAHNSFLDNTVNVPIEREMIFKAMSLGFEHGSISNSLLMRRLKTSLAESCEIIKILSNMGIIDSNSEFKPHRIVITKEDWYRIKPMLMKIGSTFDLSDPRFIVQLLEISMVLTQSRAKNNMLHSYAPKTSLSKTTPFPQAQTNSHKAQEYHIDNMNGYEFEDWCVDLLKNNGFKNIELTPRTNDKGVDILAEKDEIKYAIQCKCYSTDLGNQSIQEIVAGKTLYNCHVGVVMTNRHFTDGAILLAKANNVLLWDRETLNKLSNNRIAPIKSFSKVSFDDPLSYKAIELGFEYGYISSSMIMRKLKIGYIQSARIVDELELKGIVPPPEDNKPRPLLITYDEFLQMRTNN